MLKAIHAQESKKAAREKSESCGGPAEERRMKLKEAAKKVEDSVEETLTYCDFSYEHWTRIRTNNVIERLVQRSAAGLGWWNISDGNSALMLVCARLRRSRHPVGQQEVHEYEALRGGSGRRLYCWLTSFSQSLQTNFRITLDGTLTPHLSGAAVTQQPSIMISRILRSVASIPSFAIRQKLSIVFSYCSFTNPSPGRNTQPRLAASHTPSTPPQ